MGRQPKIIASPTAQHGARAGVKIIGVSSDVGGCLVHLEVIDGRLRIEVYRADDTVDVIALGVRHGE